MDRKLRDRKRKQTAVERVRSSVQAFEREMHRSERLKAYEPDLDDLEALARYFEGAVKCMKRLNDKAVQKKGQEWEVSTDGTTWITAVPEDGD